MADMHEYEVDLRWNSERKGTLSSPVLPMQIEVATPPEFPKDGKLSFTGITLRPKVELSSLLQEEGRVKRMLEMSEKACAISNSLKTRIILEPSITVVSEVVTF